MFEIAAENYASKEVKELDKLYFVAFSLEISYIL